jgi:hypothetical protein
MRGKLIKGSMMAVVAVVAAVPFGSALPASADGSQRVYLAANGKAASSAAVEPSTAPISRDSSLALSGLRWTSWADRATGTGTATINLCDPSCATGTAVKTPVTLTLSAPQQVCGREFYTQMQLTFTGAVPDGVARTTSVPIAPFC